MYAHMHVVLRNTARALKRTLAVRFCLEHRLLSLLAAGLTAVCLALVLYDEEIKVYRNVYGGEGWPSSLSMPRTITKSEHQALIALTAEFLEHCRRANVTVVMSFGTLIGSYMFHDLVPWDDDVDLWIPYGDLPKVKRYFRNATVWRTHGLSSWRPPLTEFDLETLQEFPANTPDEALYRHGGANSSHVFKFFRLDSPYAGRYRWRWPFLDVVFYRENSTHVWNDEFKDPLFILKEQFYPFVRRPFAGLWLNAPANAAAILRARYGAFLCYGNRWSHRRERSFASWFRYRTPCRELWDVYPQVWVEQLDPTTEREILKLGDRVLHSYVIRSPVSPEVPTKRPLNF